MIVRKENYPTFARLFNDFFDKEFSDWTNSNYSETNTTLPAVNIKENDNEFIVEVAVPGMDKKDFNIDLNDNILTISSDKKEEKTDENEKYTRREYSYQSFTRAFTLPKDIVDGEKIKAKYENGELIITIPKKEELKPKGPIKINIK